MNVSSALGLVGIGRVPQSANCAAKGGVLSLKRELAAHWATRHVRVNATAPECFRSEMSEGMSDSRGLEYIRRTVPMERPAELGEVAQAMGFLAGKASSYVAGQTLVVDGGWMSI